jgi:hypothetical protein
MRKLLIAMGALTLLLGCTAQASIPTAKNTAPQSQASAQTQFNFPKAQCGDQPTGGNDTWYPVWVDGGNLETIHRNFCADAISTLQESYSSSSSPTYTTPTYTTSTLSTSGGSCDSPDELDSRGHRCSGRAASVRSGGRGRGRR